MPKYTVILIRPEYEVLDDCGVAHMTDDLESATEYCAFQDHFRQPASVVLNGKVVYVNKTAQAAGFVTDPQT